MLAASGFAHGVPALSQCGAPTLPKPVPSVSQLTQQITCTQVPTRLEYIKAPRHKLPAPTPSALQSQSKSRCCPSKPHLWTNWCVVCRCGDFLLQLGGALPLNLTFCDGLNSACVCALRKTNMPSQLFSDWRSLATELDCSSVLQ